jgi:hypothetical protein
LGKPWFAYLMIFLLQVKVVWGWWAWDDLTMGDTSSYFCSAYNWFHSFHVNIVWSPLYAAFYGSFLFLTPDVYLATVLHRLFIVLLASVLVLALLRRLLPPGLAWLTAAWWVILPINFNTLYEVHLFALLPVLAVWLIIQWRDSPWSRGCALAVMFVCCLLVRNELAIGAGLLAMSCMLYEIVNARRHGACPSVQYVMAYGVPLALAASVLVFFYSRSTVKGHQLSQALKAKHTFNLGQVYAFGYQQRHPEWNHNAWYQYPELMIAHFGREPSTLGDMIAANPRAAWEHFRWNFGLTPNGLQLLLFNASSGGKNPDYVPCKLRQSYPLWLSLSCAGIWVVGLCFLVRERRFWWHSWLRERALTWVAMLAVAAVALVVIPTVRPRPSYLFPLSVLLMAITGMAAFVIVRRLNWLNRLSRTMPLVMAGVFLAVPSYFGEHGHRPPRLLHALIQRLQPFQELIASPRTVFLKGEYPEEVRNYLGHGACKSYSYSLLDEWGEDVQLDSYLEERGVNLFYIDEALMQRLRKRASTAGPFLNLTDNASWKLIGFEDVPGCRWKLFQRFERPFNDSAAGVPPRSLSGFSPGPAKPQLALGPQGHQGHRLGLLLSGGQFYSQMLQQGRCD